MKLSKNFTLEEFTRSSRAGELKIDNTPSVKEIRNIQVLIAEVLQPLRDLFGASITITSGYRCPGLNFAIGGSAGSQHTRGQAADLDTNDNKRLFDLIRKNLDFDQVIWEYGDDKQPDWVHVSYVGPGANRRRALRTIGKKGGKLYEIFREVA